MVVFALACYVIVSLSGVWPPTSRKSIEVSVIRGRLLAFYIYEKRVFEERGEAGLVAAAGDWPSYLTEPFPVKMTIFPADGGKEPLRYYAFSPATVRARGIADNAKDVPFGWVRKLTGISGRYVLFCDGTMELLSEDEFAKLGVEGGR